MFEWISSLALVIFEVICCVMFFESFCKEQGNWKKWHKYVLIGIQTAEFFACGMFLSQWIIIKQIVRMYDTKGKLQDSKYYSRVLSSKGQLQTDLIQTNRSYKVKATGSVYRGPSVSSGQLESVTITIN